MMEEWEFWEVRKKITSLGRILKKINLLGEFSRSASKNCSLLNGVNVSKHDEFNLLTEEANKLKLAQETSSLRYFIEEGRWGYELKYEVIKYEHYFVGRPDLLNKINIRISKIEDIMILAKDLRYINEMNKTLFYINNRGYDFDSFSCFLSMIHELQKRDVQIEKTVDGNFNLRWNTQNLFCSMRAEKIKKEF